jgi:signal transduction histidine kinase
MPADSLDDFLPTLMSAGLLCVVGLTFLKHRSTAWLATIGAAFVVTIDIATYARQVRPFVDDVGWQWLGIAVSLSAVLCVAAAAAYAFGRPRFRHGRLGFEATLLVVGVVTVLSVWALSNPDELQFIGRIGSDLGSLGLVTRTFLVLVPVFTGLGVLGDLVPPAERAWRRVGVTHRAPTNPIERVRAWTVAFADELSPGRRRARWAMLSERSRFARDLHADVVPGLRQALVDAERGVPPDRLAATLRGVLSDLEAVGQEQHPIQLEIGGLVPALEWFAERIERQSSMVVTIDVADPPDGADGTLPPDIAASAFRIAGLALANVAWHTPDRKATIAVTQGPSFLDLSIADEGPGITDEAIAAARAGGRRGIADMVAEAAMIGASLDIGRGPGGVGTVVSLRWRAANAD